jgi:hypothetical protein
MSEFLQLITNDSVDRAIEMLRVKGNKVSNAKNNEGVGALMMATNVKPFTKAISLINALI